MNPERVVSHNNDLITIVNPLPVTSVGGGGSTLVTDIQDGAGDSVMDAANNAVRVNLVVGTIVGGTGGTAQADKSTFTEGTSSFTPVGGEFNDSPSDPSSGQAAAARITAKRALHINLRSAAGVELGTSSAPVRVDPTGSTAQPITDNAGSLTVDAPVAAPLPIAVTTTGDALVKVGDAGNDAVRVNIVAGAASSGQADKSSFVEGTTTFQPVGGVLNETAASDPTEDQAAAARITAKRALHVNLRGAAGTEIGTSGAPVRTDPTGTTAQPVTDNDGSLTVDGSVVATQGTSPWVVGDGGGSLTVDAPAVTPVPVAVTDTSDTVVKAGDAGNNAIRVNIVAGSSSSGQADKSTFTEGTTVFMPVGGEFNDSPSDPATGQAAASRITAKRAIHVNLRSNAGTELGTSGAPVRTDPTGTTAQPVTDNGGSLTVDGTVSVGNTPTVDQGTSPWVVDQIDTASLDYDTGIGTVNQTIFGLALPGSGGPVAGGTATNPVRTDPTGSTAQPVTDNGGSLTVDGAVTVSGTVTANQGTAAAGSGAWPVAITDTSDVVVKPGDAGNSAVRTNVVVALPAGTNNIGDVDVLTLPATTNAGATAKTLDYDTGAGTDTVTAFGLLLPKAGGAVAGGTSTDPVRVDPTGTTTQPVSAASLPLPTGAATEATLALLPLTQGSTTSGQSGPLVQGAVTTAAPAYTTAQTSPLSLTTAGGLRVDGSDVTQPISGTVTANQGGAPWSAVGTLTHDSAAPSSNNLGVLPAVANAAAPSYTEGDQVLLSVDLAGSLRTSGSSGGSGADVVKINDINSQAVVDDSNRRLLEQILIEVQELSRRMFDDSSLS